MVGYGWVWLKVKNFVVKLDIKPIFLLPAAVCLHNIALLGVKNFRH